MKITFLLALILWTCAATQPAFAAVITLQEEKPGTKIFFTGPIEVGDVSRMEEALEKMYAHRTEGGIPVGGPYGYVQFDSPGGSLAEALKIGALLRDQLLASAVPDGKACIGACAWAFLGGSAGYVTGGHRTDRDLQSGGRLIFTHFEHTPDDVDISELMTYGTRMDISLKWLAQVFSLGRNELLYVDEIADLHIERLRTERRLSPEEQAVMSCNEATGWQRPLRVGDAKFGSANSSLATVNRLTFQQFRLTVFSSVLARSNPNRVSPVSALIKRTMESNDDQAMAALLKQFKEIDWSFDFERAGDAFSITGWQKKDAVDIQECLVLTGQGKGATQVVLLATGNIKVVKVVLGDDLRSNYRKQSFY